MPLQVSIFCGKDSSCDHNHAPVLKAYRCCPIEVGDISEGNSSSWTELRRTSSESATVRGRLAKSIIEEVDCSAVLVLSSLSRACDNDACEQSVHVLDYHSKEHMSKAQQVLTASSYICQHSSNAFVRLAMDQNDVVISNDPFDDPRVIVDIPKADHFPIRSIMVIPLLATSKLSEKSVGAVLLVNKRNPEGCNGFREEDYVNFHSTFYGLGTHILSLYYEETIHNRDVELQKLQEKYTADLNSLSLSRDAFIATMSHEIRTPLNAIKGYNEIMMNMKMIPSNSSLFAQHLRRQQDAMTQLIQLIANILDYTKLKSQGLTLKSDAFNLQHIIERCLTVCGPEANAKHINISVRVDPEMPETLIGDEERLRQVITNLITNAVKYTSHGYIILSASASKTDDDKTRVQISVKDSGRGIPLHLQDKVFEDFKQIRDSSSSAVSTQGVGLGLAICRELVHLMHGDIWVESDGRTGSTFHFTAELRDSESVQNIMDEAQKQLGHAPVLIVDDKEINRVLLSKIVLDWGFIPIACSSLGEGMQMVQTFPAHYFKIALIDIDINGESGVDLARRIINDPTLDHIKLIAVSSIGNEFPGSSVFHAVHTKPVRPPDLLADVIRSMRKSSTLPPLQQRLSRRGNKATDILIIDDDEPSLDIATLMMSQSSFDGRIHRADSAKRGLEILHNNIGKIGCVFMDIVMPTMDGVECTRVIKQSPDRYGAPIIVALTADAVDSTRTTVLASGASYFLSKPVSLADMKGVIKKVFPRKRRASRKKK